MALTAPLLKEDPSNPHETPRNGLLAVAAATFVAALLFESTYLWVGYVRAATETAIVGGLADWFAVTALSRHRSEYQFHDP